jgi:alpha-glucuronidase
VLWRAFVYGGVKEDRAKQAYDQFRPLDGKFRSNVIVQVKNGPIDFQPREPFSPLFGQMRHTNIGLELQITREYLGQNSGIVYLGTMWSEVLHADTCSPHCGTPVSATIAAVAGVANIGSDANWTGNDFDQANWYAFGRLAWDPSLRPQQIADEWTRMTWSNDPRAVRPIVAMMMRSREATVDYMTPLGLAHQMASGHHYGPGPWECAGAQQIWNPCFYNQADSKGIGFDRTARGSNAVAQYAPPVAERFATLTRVPDEDLLWFHHLPWTYRMRDGRPLWRDLLAHYDRGLGTVTQMRKTWSGLKPFVDPQRYCEVAASLDQQEREARWWRDASIAYWRHLSKLPLPRGVGPPAHPLSWYEAIKIGSVPGFGRPDIPPRTGCGRSGGALAGAP